MEVKTSTFVLFVIAFKIMGVTDAFLNNNALNRTTYDKNNPFDLPVKKVVFYDYGVVFDLYRTPNEVRNLVVPTTAYEAYDLSSPKATNHPPVFFNMFKGDNCLGFYVLKNLTAHKINDGRDSAFDIPDCTKLKSYEDLDKNVYIGTADGISVYNIDTEQTSKYGTIAEDIISIDKVTNKKELYIVNADHKVYKVINEGSELVPIEAIKYAKKLVVDYLENLYFIGEDNVPQVLVKGENSPNKFSEFNFNISNPVLGREVMNAMSQETDVMIPFLVDGVLYVMAKNRSEAFNSEAIVPGVTAFSAEFTFVHYYAVNGLIYQHVLLANEIPQETVDDIESAEQPSSENEIDTERPVEVFERDLRKERRRLKKIKRRH